jgi:putative (di)nucleoside polyphosphate hydrolase
MIGHENLVYRLGVGIVLINKAGLILVARRRKTQNAWQMPQGGIDDDETPRHAAMRELKEEIGTNNVEILAETTQWFYYDIPRSFRSSLIWRGQKQKWILARFVGHDNEVNLETMDKPEFDAWCWVGPQHVPNLVVWFKRSVYQAVLKEFDPFIIANSRQDI